MVERQAVDHRPEAKILRTLCNSRQEDAGRCCHAEWREVMFGDVIAVEAGAIIGLDDLQSVFVKLAQRQVAAIDMVENSNLQHGRFLKWLPLWRLVMTVG